MKRCGKCGETKPHTEFNKNKAKPDGYQGRCRECQRSGERSHYASNEDRKERVRWSKFRARTAARAFMYKYLGENPCVDCGESDRVVLDLDHVRGEKDHDVSVMVARGFSLPKIQAEVAKCEVRCANCHRRATAKRDGSWYRATGIFGSFSTFGDFADEL
ncbi:HNH endonuclease [Mycobacterium phage Lewan]|nr:HNH endonuclease [Mycobacterium phage Lewan]